MNKQPDKPRNKPARFGRPGSGVPSAVIWFAVGGLLTLLLALQSSWPPSNHPAPETSLSWPQNDRVFPEFSRALIIQLSTSAIFFLLVPLTSLTLPRHVLRRPRPDGYFDFRLSSAGYWLMWVALAVFAASFFSLGTARSVACWLLAVVLVWLAALLTSAARIGRVFGETRQSGSSLPPRRTWGIMIGDGVQLVVYPFLAAIACGWLLDLARGAETFVPAGAMPGASHASTGGGPFVLWELMFSRVAWPTVMACIVPVAGLLPLLIARPPKTASDNNPTATPNEQPSQAGDTPAPTEDQPPVAEQADVARTVWTVKAWLLAVVCYLLGITFLGLAVRWDCVAAWPSCQALGLNWGIALGVAAGMVAAGVCLHIGVRGAVDPHNTVFHAWIAGAVLATILCGATVARQLSSLSQRGLQPFGSQQMVYRQADLNYASAVRLRVLEIGNELTTREADEGILSPDEVALRELCQRLLTKLIEPTELTAVETQQPESLAALAEVMAAGSKIPPEDAVFDGTPAELAALMRDIRSRRNVMRLPIVVPGGRDRMGVYCLFGAVFIAYMAALLAALAVTVIKYRGLARSRTLRELTLAWHLGGLFAVTWLFLA